MTEHAKRARQEKFRCTLTCWAAAGLFTAVGFAALLRSEAWSFVQAVFGAGVIFLALGVAFALLFCRPLPGPVIGPGATPGRRPAAAARAETPTETTAGTTAQPTAETTAEATAANPTAAPQTGTEALQRLRGVGPKLATALDDAGVNSLAQVAGWSAEEVAWWDDNLEGFKGRASRDDWAGQARQLLEQDAAGGDAARQE